MKKLENFSKSGHGFGRKFGQNQKVLFTRHDIAASKMNIFFFACDYRVQRDQMYRKIGLNVSGVSGNMSKI